MSEVSLQEHAVELASELLEEIELSRTPVSQQVRKAARLARVIGDEVATTWLRFELNGVPNSEAGRSHMTRTSRWTDKENARGLWGPTADAEAAIESMTRQLEASRIESFSGEKIVFATRQHRESQASLSAIIVQHSRIVNRVSALLHDFAARTYYELRFSAEQRSLFEKARREIDGPLAPTGGHALEQVDSIYRRLSEGDREAISQAMNTCRRLIDQFADAVYPPSAEPIVRDGQTIEVGANRTQNRINEYFHGKVTSDSRRKRVKRSLSDLYDRVSTGVHNDVTTDEARFLFLATYTLLGEVLAAGDNAGI